MLDFASFNFVAFDRSQPYAKRNFPLKPFQAITRAKKEIFLFPWRRNEIAEKQIQLLSRQLPRNHSPYSSYGGLMRSTCLSSGQQPLHPEGRILFTNPAAAVAINRFCF